MFSSIPSLAISLLALTSTSLAHIVMTYPGWRGDNLHTTGNASTFAASGGLGAGPDGTYPYGMQWIYPCGGMPLTTNRTLWPVTGGAVAFEPGWFQGHSVAFVYVNLGIGTLPTNMSLNMVPVFQIVGPTNTAYPNQSVCLPQVPLPAGYTPQIGDNATIQVVEAAQHGAALYSCVDITFADPADVEQVGPNNCQNTSGMAFNLVFGTSSLTGAASTSSRPAWTWAVLPALVAGFVFGVL